MKNEAISMLGTPMRLEYGEWNTNTPDAKSRYGGKITDAELKRRLKSELLKSYSSLVQPDHGSGAMITFEEFMQTRPDGGDIWLNKHGQPFAWPDLLQVAGIDPATATLNSLATMDSDFRGIFSVLISDLFIRGFASTPAGNRELWSALCCETGVPTQLDNARRGWLKFDGEPVRTAEGERFPEGSVCMGAETIQLEKFGINFRISEELNKATPLSIMSNMIVEVGRRYAVKENQRAVTALISGDLTSGLNAAPIIGVNDVATGIDYSDFLRTWTKGAVLGESYYTVVANESMAYKLGLIDEFKERALGKAQVGLINKPEPDSIDRYVSADVPNNQVLLLDQSHALRQRVFQPIRIDRAFRPQDWTNGVTIGYISGFECMGEKARLVIDEAYPIQNIHFLRGIASAV